MSKIIKKAGLVMILMALIYSLSNNIMEYKKKMTYFENYVTVHKKADDKNKQLKTEILNQKDLYKLEKDVRNRLGRSKPGEVVLVLPEITPKLSPTPTPVVPIYKQWIALFLP